MPRFRREYAPGHVHHVIARCIGGEFLIHGDSERENYLSRIAKAARASGWVPLCFGIMNNHVHWGVIASEAPVAAFTRPIHTGFAGWLNRRRGRIGPIFTGRPTVRVRRAEDTGALIAYIHNNPVRASVVANALESTWTSQRAYAGAAEAPPWLDWRLGLSLAGFDATRNGRARFAAMVGARAAEPRDPSLSVVFEAGRRARLRQVLGSGVEVGSPYRAERGEHVTVYAPEAGVVRRQWRGDVRVLLIAAAVACGVRSEVVTSRDRSRRVVNARRLVLLAGTQYLGKPINELAAAVGISSPAAVQLLRNRPAATAALRGTARELAETLRDAEDETET